MKLKVRLNFVEPWATIIPQCAEQCKMTVDEYCRRAVQVLTKQGLEEGASDEGSNVPSGDGLEVRAGDGTDSAALADKKDP